MNNDEIIKRNNELFTELKKYPEDTKEYRDIVGKIIANNEPLVIHIAQKYLPTAQLTALNRDDLVAEGLWGLPKAIKQFKSEIGVPFGNYAGQYIQKQILIRLKRERKHRFNYSLEGNKSTLASGTQQKYEDVLAAPVNIEADVLDKDERERQVAWVRKNLDQLNPRQKRVIVAKYLSEPPLSDHALAQELECSQQRISEINKIAIAKLNTMYRKLLPEEQDIELTTEEKIAAKEVLKNLILTKLAPQQKKTTLCKFFSPTQKSNKQVAQAINITESAVRNYITKADKKLFTLYNGIPNQKHLTSKAIRNILEFRAEENEKEL